MTVFLTPKVVHRVYYYNNVKNECAALKEGPEGVKWELVYGRKWDLRH